MKLYNLGHIPWPLTQLYYHALARLGGEGLILCAPSEPYVSLGFHQDLEQELDGAYCREQGIPVFRREVGGGAVYLDGNQLFWQVVLHRDNPLAPLSRDAFYRKFLAPVVEVYRAIGVDARVDQLNDLAAGRRKIAGTGAGEIGDCVVFVGNLIRAFDFDAMSRVLKVPNERFREKYRQCMSENMTSLRRELGQTAETAISDETLFKLTAEAYEKVLGPLTQAKPDEALMAEAERLGRRMLSPSWTRFARKPRPGRQLKVRGGVFLKYMEIETRFGGLNLLCTLEEGRPSRIELSGPGLGRSSRKLAAA